MTDFQLDPAFEKGSIHLLDGPLSQIRLMKDGELTWFLLIPKKAHLRDLIDLNMSDQHLLLKEMNLCQNLIREYTQCEKINIGALGNLTPQLHIHIIARYKNDRAWPGPIWGTTTNLDFDQSQVLYWTKLLSSKLESLS